MIEKLKEIKDYYGWSYKDLERETGVDDSVLHNYVTGRYGLRGRNQQLIEEFINKNDNEASG